MEKGAKRGGRGRSNGYNIDVQGTEGVEELGRIQYNREAVNVVKHEKDICYTNKPSLRSEAVKDLALSDVISERKILVPKRDRGRNIFAASDGMSSDNISLDEVIWRKQNQKTSAQNVDKSLDEIIGQSERDVRNGQKRKSEEELEMDMEMTDRYIKTPLEVVEELTTHEGLIIEREFSKLGADISARTHNWRAKLTCGEISVVVEAPFKDLVKQAGAFELIKILKEVNPELKFSKCRIPEGCFYDPGIPRRLAEAAERDLKMEDPRYETVMTRKNGRDFYILTYFIGEDEFQAEGFFLDHVDLFAAKAAYETYTGTKFYRQNYYVGENCMSDDNFDCVESEAVHAMTIMPAVPQIDSFEDTVPPIELPKPERTNEEELLVDENGRLYVKSIDGGNKIRRLMKLSDLYPDQAIPPTKNLLASNGKIRPSLDLKSVGDSDRFPTLEEEEMDY